MFRRKIKPISELVSQSLRNNGLETPLLQKRLMDNWAQVVGPTINQYSPHKYINNQTLYVKITNPSLRADLSMMKSELVRRLNQTVGSMVITDIRLF
ncbi:MAG TPA: DUF721 domain-containing protein [Candidatus Prevotella avicola]|uniref:DUF721 domain-containing protein n=1 Tax=Candidatus Prevotella avicola TaxID=2838738 RepID=A0A9D2FYG1_9BACT|nr:DUF721 domain-containing protein [Candidatus Prevotella avicola]